MSALLKAWTVLIESMSFDVWHYPDAVLKEKRDDWSKRARCGTAVARSLDEPTPSRAAAKSPHLSSRGRSLAVAISS